MSPSTRVAVESFWEYVAFALNSIVFLLVGFEVKLASLFASWQVIVAAFLAVVVGRALVVYGIAGVLSRSAERLPPKWRAVLTWGGLRGSLSMVLALSLPATFPHRDLLVTTTFGVVVLSILVQGLSMAPLLRWMGVIREEETRQAHELIRGELGIARAAERELDQMGKGSVADRGVIEQLRTEYAGRIEDAEARLKELHLEKSQLRESELRRARRHLLIVEKEQVLKANHEGLLGREVYERLVSDIDGRLLQLDEGSGEEE
jgi:CPA1 family monovalent cation:H+ antiporter